MVALTLSWSLPSGDLVSQHSVGSRLHPPTPIYNVNDYIHLSPILVNKEDIDII